MLARYFGITEPVDSATGKKLFQDIADELLNPRHPGLHNQAMMEFGAMLCKPKNPDCGICPLRTGCFAWNNNAIADLPRKVKKAAVRQRYLNYLVIRDADTVVMNKRDEGDIWANMYDLPLIESAGPLSPDAVMAQPQVSIWFGKDIQFTRSYPVKKHVLTHQHLHAQFIHIADRPLKPEKNWIYASSNELEKLPMPKIIFSFLDKFLSAGELK